MFTERDAGRLLKHGATAEQFGRTSLCAAGELLTRILLTALAVLMGVVVAEPVQAEARGMFVVLRDAPDPNAPVAERVELYKKSYALVIGNDAYGSGWPRLSNGVKDAEQVAEMLEQQGFEVSLETDLDSVGLRNTLEKFFVIQGKDPDARLLFWYAGHGHSFDDEGFLVPVDAPAPSDPEFALRALHMRSFGSYMRLAKSKHVLAIFDSCFSGTIFTTRAGAVPPAITHVTTKPTRQFLTSGDAGQTVSDDGTFRKLFLSALRGETYADSNGDGYLTASELGLFMSNEVTNYTERAQTPRYGKLRDPDFDRGDFVFLLPGRQPTATEDETAEETASSAAAAAVDIEALMAETVLWTTVRTSEDPTVIEAYLEEYPSGRFAQSARTRIEELQAMIAEEEAATATLTVEDGGDKAKAEETDETSQEGDRMESPSDAGDAVGTPPVVTEAPDLPALKLEGGVELTSVERSSDTSWLPNVEAGQDDFFKLTSMRHLPNAFLGSGPATAALSADGQLLSKDVGPQGYTVDASAWRFSDPQGDSQYQVDGNWLHMRAGANHNIWDCDRGLAPILSVPAPSTDIWSAQAWVQLPARIGRSHAGLVVWNGVDRDGPTRALYFGPSDTRDLGAAGSYRNDCSGGANDLAAAEGSRGRFNVEYAGGRGWLRVSKNADRLTFYFKSPFMHNWRTVGSMMTEGKDNLVNIGLIAKTWGNEPLVASFSNFRLIPGHAGVETWAPAYHEALERDGAVLFRGEDFADFEWNDPNGDSVHEISDVRVRIKTSGGRDIWNCDRGSAPILSVDTPKMERWAAEVDFDLPARTGKTMTGLVLWNDEFENAPVHALYFGPAGTTDLGVAGSNAVDCTAGANDLRNLLGSEGPFNIQYNRGRGKLRIARDGDRVSFYFKSPGRRNWELVGATLATVRDGFTKVGLVGKNWGSEPLNATFSNFRIIAGETQPEHWIPSYYSGLRTGEPTTFRGEAFADFEWSDPDGNSVHEIRGNWIRLETTGGHPGAWDCKRNKAPLLTVPVPPRDTWLAQVRFRIPERASKTSAGLVLWNGAEHGRVRLVGFGPNDTQGLGVGGSYSDDCTAYAGEIAQQEGNTGPFTLAEGGDEGYLQIVKFGWFYKFAYFDPATRTWTELGTMETTVKDNFTHIGLTVSSWGSNPITAEFQDFTLVPGVFN